MILNEHLTEALRRLKKDTSENSVDRRLVTNVLISFFNTPRADSKRFEMLSLLASILSWNDDDRERAGLQRSSGGGHTGPSSSISPVGPGRARGHSRTSAGRTGEEVMGDNEVSRRIFLASFLSSDELADFLQPLDRVSPARSVSAQHASGRYRSIGESERVLTRSLSVTTGDADFA